MVTTAEQNGSIQTVEHLHFYLRQALILEHATIPPYITALYSIHPGTNIEACQIIRSVAVEEMLHLTLVANVLNAVGGDLESTLTAPDFIPPYPDSIPTGETDFEVGLAKFSKETVQTFCNIERSKEVDEDLPLVKPRSGTDLLQVCGAPNYSFYSIGLFYAEIIRGINALYRKMGNSLFCGDYARQITPEYYFNGAGNIVPVTDIRSAIRALRVIQEQGEGSRSGTIYDAERELSHFYRFDQLLKGRYYVVNKADPESSDRPDEPSGDHFTVDWEAVYPIQPNATWDDYPEESELYTAARQFQSAYSEFLCKIEQAFSGNPQDLVPAVGGMFRLKYHAEKLIKNPIPGQSGVNAAPIFRLN